MIEPQVHDKNKFADVPIRIRSWGIILLLFFVALLHPILTCLFVCFLSFWGMKEFFAMMQLHNRNIFYTQYVFIIAEFYLLYTTNYSAFAGLVLLYALLVILLNALQIKDLQRSNIPIFISIMLCGFSIGHLAFIKEMNSPTENISGLNILLLLVILTELNDVFQYLTGKTFGKHKITPKISPNKTIEGFLGGACLTILLANLLGPFLLADKPFMLYTLLGFLISILGFCGDIFMSSIKRKAAVKDTSKLIPGHGGLLDRIDSLLFITPIYYWLLYFTYIH